MPKLTRPMDTDSTFRTQAPMDPKWYKFLVQDCAEWPLDAAARKLRDVLSFRWILKCVEDPVYNGREKWLWTTYWASDEKVAASWAGTLQKYLQQNPGATEEEAKKARIPWNPSEATYQFLWACGLMTKDADKSMYVPVGWELTQDGFEEALTAAVNCVIWAKVGPDKDNAEKYPDNIQEYSPVLEQ